MTGFLVPQLNTYRYEKYQANPFKHVIPECWDPKFQLRVFPMGDYPQCSPKGNSKYDIYGESIRLEEYRMIVLQFLSESILSVNQDISPQSSEDPVLLSSFVNLVKTPSLLRIIHHHLLLLSLLFISNYLQCYTIGLSPLVRVQRLL